MAIDLVRHSTKPRFAAQRARQILEDTFKSQAAALGLEDIAFNYTGDGYLCALFGDDSARILDFINATIPVLKHELASHDQELRAGVDFGLVHLRHNTLTGSREHFDLPGIVASRLEGAASPGEVLASAAIYDLFTPLYPEVFGERRVAVTKDRDIVCYPTFPLDFEAVLRDLRATLFPARGVDALTPAERGALLLVDDDPGILALLSGTLNDAFEAVVSVDDGAKAIVEVEKREFSIIIVDLVLPDMNGLDVTRRVLDLRPASVIVMMTGHSDPQCAADFFTAGGALFFHKPIDPRSWLPRIDRCLSGKAPGTLRRQLEMFCDDIGPTAVLMHRVSEEYQRVMSRSESDAAISLLRHKAKGLCDDFIRHLKPGCDLSALLNSLAVQLASLNRLCAIVQRVGATDILTYVDSLVADYGKLHPNVELHVGGSVETGAEVEHPTLYILAVCELIDNAIAAVSASGGNVDVDLVSLPAAGILHARIADSGSGLPQTGRPDVFAVTTSTKGSGRGLGLGLVREAAERLDGRVSYKYENGAVFTLDAPLRAR